MTYLRRGGAKRAKQGVLALTVLPGLGVAKVVPVTGSNTRGAWVEISSGLPTDQLIVGYIWDSPGGSGQDYGVFYIGTGAAGSEVERARIPSQLGQTFKTQMVALPVPILVPANTRIVVACHTDLGGQIGSKAHLYLADPAQLEEIT